MKARLSILFQFHGGARVAEVVAEDVAGSGLVFEGTRVFGSALVVEGEWVAESVPVA